MTRLYTAEVLADSISPEGHRITSVKVIYPHAVHKDMLRHRAHNRNVESFRAQKPEDLIETLRTGGAFMPDVFASRTKGMGQGEALVEQETATALWRTHIENVTWVAEDFLKLGIAKQQVNFLLQDLCPLTEIITATDWDNFFALRMELKDDGTPVARPEVYKTAEAIHAAMGESTPVKLEYGELHLPCTTNEELDDLRGHFDAAKRNPDLQSMYASLESTFIWVSAGRCARISFGEYDWRSEHPNLGYKRADRLVTAGHMSPFEQQAKMFSEQRWETVINLQEMLRVAGDLPERETEDMCRQLEYSGNLHGWVPARKTFPNEDNYAMIKAAMS